jgi:hypothetical protein
VFGIFGAPKSDDERDGANRDGGRTERGDQKAAPRR